MRTLSLLWGGIGLTGHSLSFLGGDAVAVEPRTGESLYVTGTFLSAEARVLAGLKGTTAYEPNPSLLKVRVFVLDA